MIIYADIVSTYHSLKEAIMMRWVYQWWVQLTMEPFLIVGGIAPTFLLHHLSSCYISHQPDKILDKAI